MTEYSFLVTPYQGYEEEALRVRNRNREISQNRAYFDWRYLGQKVEHQPEILWVKSSSGNYVGMASLIYHHYWINDKKVEIMVLGDISLDKKYRGTGLINKFFLFVNEHIKKKQDSPFALVIPNEAAQKVLSRAGWEKKEKLVHHVLLLRPEKKIYSLLKAKSLAWLAGKLYRVILWVKHSAVKNSDFVIKADLNFDDEIDDFWEKYDRKKICQRDMSANYLQWRYGDYPGKKESFSIVKCYFTKELVAYLVVSFGEKTCVVYDIIALDKKYIPCLVKAFITLVQKKRNIRSIRIILNETNPYSDALVQLGFCKRKENSLFKIFFTDNFSASLGVLQWIVTAGDKDS